MTDLLNPSSSDIPTDTTNFDKNLSVADDTVQKALETLDELVGVIAESIDVLELDHPFKTEIDLGSVSGAVTIDWSEAGRYKLNLTGNVTITMTNYSAYAVSKIQDIFIKSSGTGYTITWQSGVDVTDFTAVPIDFSLTTIVNHISVRCLNATTPNFQMSNYLIP